MLSNSSESLMYFTDNQRQVYPENICEERQIEKKMAPTIRVASMAKAVVKSSQEMGNLALRLVNSRRRMRKVTQKQKHHVNIHHVQKEKVVWPTDATRLKVIKVKITSSILTMPTGAVSVFMSSVTMMIVILLSVHSGSG